MNLTFEPEKFPKLISNMDKEALTLLNSESLIEKFIFLIISNRISMKTKNIHQN